MGCAGGTRRRSSFISVSKVVYLGIEASVAFYLGSEGKPSPGANPASKVQPGGSDRGLPAIDPQQIGYHCRTVLALKVLERTRSVGACLP